MSSINWDPGQYARFSDQRLRPALDLLARVPALPVGDVVDLGCGNGAVGPALGQRFSDRALIGVDNSATMLDTARETGVYRGLVQADIQAWRPDRAPALIFSNAALHWLDDHDRLLPRLTGLLAPGGTLAVQMPHQNNAPSHRLWVQLAEELFPHRIDPDAQPGIQLPADYVHMLEDTGGFALWETEYYQLLPAAEQGHPVRRFTEATFARPVLEALRPDEQARLIAAYEEVIGSAYPSMPDGRVLFPFRRLFFILTRP